MAKIELGYIEIDGLLYPDIETGMENIESDLGKYGILRLGIYMSTSEKRTVNYF